ncbi:MAG: hypothetical protein JSU85_06505 [Candidatus Zixiibacteriota bacterium]|nr:MAG: hypothetical protein JSU85_06505 [candidate division Zixibacteria bacterium]
MTETEMILEEIRNLKTQVEELEKKLLDPDEGLYARVKENTDFRKTARKVIGVISAATIGLIAKLAYEAFKKLF